MYKHIYKVLQVLQEPTIIIIIIILWYPRNKKMVCLFCFALLFVQENFVA